MSLFLRRIVKAYCFQESQWHLSILAFRYWNNPIWYGTLYIDQNSDYTLFRLWSRNSEIDYLEISWIFVSHSSRYIHYLLISPHPDPYPDPFWSILINPHPSSSILIHHHLSSSILIHPHSPSSILIHPHPSSSILIHPHPHPSSSIPIHPHPHPFSFVLTLPWCFQIFPLPYFLFVRTHQNGMQSTFIISWKMTFGKQIFVFKEI